jgi:hypothetical protein
MISTRQVDGDLLHGYSRQSTREWWIGHGFPAAVIRFMSSRRASACEGDPVVSLVVRTHDRRTAKELDDVGGMGTSLDQARGVHAALGEAIRAAEMAARRSTE